MEFLIPPLGFWLIVWVVMASSSVVSSQNEVAWNHATRKELLELYLDRMPADMIAHYFGCTPAEIIRQLAYLVLGEGGSVKIAKPRTIKNAGVGEMTRYSALNFSCAHP